jgi:CDP-glycerol glycerophosphotransferase (TagB/SpsB family)
VLFFSPDLEEYKKNPGLFENYPELMGESAAYSLEELEDKIDLYFNKRNIFSNKSEKLNKFFNKETIISDGETYSENVYNSIINEFFNN